MVFGWAFSNHDSGNLHGVCKYLGLKIIMIVPLSILIVNA